MSLPNLPFVLVEWIDAVNWDSPASLADISTFHKPEIVHTLGWVLREDEAGVSLATEYYDEEYRGRSFIPRVNIRTVTQYKLVKPRKRIGAQSDTADKP